MKTHEEIEKRLFSLYHKYENLYVKDNLRPSPDNCSHNLLHTPATLIPRPRDLEMKLAPRKQTTLVVIDGPPRPIRICTYGSDNPESWNGDICDTEEHASQCPYFTPAESAEDLRERFRVLMADDEFVFENYKDVMALQWATGHRIQWALENSTPESSPAFYVVWWTVLLSALTRWTSRTKSLPSKE